MRDAIEEELLLVVSLYERKDAEIEAGTFNAEAPGPDPEVRVKTLKKLLSQLRQVEKQENADARR